MRSEPPASEGVRALPIGAKLALTTVFVLAVVSSIVFYALAERARRNVLESKQEAASMMANLFAVSIVASLDFGDATDVQKELGHLRVDREITYAAVWRDDSSTPVAELSVGSAVGSANGLAADDEQLAVERQIVRPDGTSLGRAQVRFSLANDFAELRNQRRWILLATIGTAALIAFLILAVVRLQIVSRLERLGAAVRRVETGELAVRVDDPRSDEVGRLASAFNTMTDAIRDRETHLADAMGRLRELFDHMRQAIVVFRADGMVQDAPAKETARIFADTPAGKSIVSLLYPGAEEGDPLRQAFETWLECAFESPPEVWNELKELAPSHVELPGVDGSLWLDLQFNPIVEGGRLQRIMLLATDVTDRHKLEDAAQTLEEEHAEQMRIMQRLIAGGGQVFASFLSSTDRRIDACLKRAARALQDAPTLNAIFEDVHTIRGEARAFDLRELAAECQGIERWLSERRERVGESTKQTTAELSERLKKAKALVDSARRLFVAASPIGAAVLDQVTVRRSDVEELVRLVAQSQRAQTAQASPAAQADTRIASIVSNLASRPFGECVAQLEATTPRWAEEVGKRARLVVEGRDARVIPQVATALTSVLPHLVRNAIAHGIETPDARTAAGKPAEGIVRVSAVIESGNLSVRIEDDGAGVNERALRARAGHLGASVASATELVFVAGVSTAEGATELAGQGVGLSAVRSELHKVGLNVEMHTEPGKNTAFVIRSAARTNEAHL